MSTTTQQQPSRLADRLEAFYGQPTLPPVELTTTASSRRKPSVLNILPNATVSSCSREFGPGSIMDPDAYVSELIATASLRELVCIASQLEEKVQQLESSAQALVYDNYSEFLTAADTAQALNFNVRHGEQTRQESTTSKATTSSSNSSCFNSPKNSTTEASGGRGAGGETHTTSNPSSLTSSANPTTDLQGRLDHILVSVQTVYDPLEVTARQSKELCRISQLIQKLDEVLGLPNKMKKAMAETRYHDVVALYLSFSQFLHEFHGHPLWPKITSAEAQNLFIEGRQNLRSSLSHMNETTADIDTTMHDIKLLMSSLAIFPEQLSSDDDSVPLLRLWTMRILQAFRRILRQNNKDEASILHTPVPSHLTTSDSDAPPTGLQSASSLSGAPRLNHLNDVITHTVLPKLFSIVESAPEYFKPPVSPGSPPSSCQGVVPSSEEICFGIDQLVTLVLEDVFGVLLESLFSQNITTEELVLTGVNLRHGLVPLSGMRRTLVGKLFSTFLKRLASKVIENKFKDLLSSIITKYLNPLVKSAYDFALQTGLLPTRLVSDCLHSEYDQHKLHEALHRFLFHCSETGQSISMAIATSITECEPVVSEFFGQVPSSSRTSLSGLIDDGVCLIFRQLGVYAESLMEGRSSGIQVIPSATSPSSEAPAEMCSTLCCVFQQYWAQYRENQRFIDLPSHSPHDDEGLPVYSHLGCLGVALVAKWLEVKSLSKLRNLFDNVFPRDRPATGSVELCRESIECRQVYERILAEVTKRWGRQLHHRFTESCVLFQWSAMAE